MQKPLATVKTSGPENVTHAPMKFVNGIDHQPVALFRRLMVRDPDAFTTTLAEDLAAHDAYRGGSAAAARTK